MSQSQNLTLEQRQQLRLSQQQLRYVRLLEDSAPEFDEAVARELEDNPALVVKANEGEHQEQEAFGETAEQLQRADYMRTEDIPILTSRRDGAQSEGMPLQISSESGESLYSRLMRQLDVLPIDDLTRTVAEYIIGSLDSNGYFRSTPSQVSDELAFGPGIEAGVEVVERALEVVRSLDPPGVGAIDLRDALILQLDKMAPSEARDDAREILEKHFKLFADRHIPQLMAAMKIDRDRLNAARDLIVSLNPKPGGAYEASDPSNFIIPDFIVTDGGDGESGDEPLITLNSRVPELQVDRTFAEAVAELTSAKGRVRRKGAEFIVDRTNDARDFIRLVRRRQETLMRVMAAIVEYQKEYFMTGDVYALRPMLIRDLAERTGEDISVISRATKNKYVQTPYGIVPMRFFFSDSIGVEDGEDALTNRKIEAAIRELTDAEDKHKPLSDRQIEEALKEKGFSASRRTVAKYRDRIGIPVARLRREL